MKTPTSIHDGLFKSFLTVPETAKDFLDVHLPGHLQSRYAPAPIRFIFGKRVSAVLFRCTVLNGDREWGRVCVRFDRASKQPR